MPAKLNECGLGLRKLGAMPKIVPAVSGDAERFLQGGNAHVEHPSAALAGVMADFSGR
jgi:hypothetical protein